MVSVLANVCSIINMFTLDTRDTYVFKRGVMVAAIVRLYKSPLEEKLHIKIKEIIQTLKLKLMKFFFSKLKFIA